MNKINKPYPQGIKLDIACGRNKREGFMGVDIVPGKGVDFIWDLEKYPWEPFRDNSVKEVFVSHYAEHTKDLIKFMDEMWRICEDGAKVTIIGPYYTSIRSWQDPTHTRTLSEATWPYYQKSWREMANIAHYPIKCDFEIITNILFFNEPWNQKSEETKKFAVQHYWNVVYDIMVELRAKKI